MEYREYILEEVIKEIIDYRGKTPKKLGGEWSRKGIKALSAKNIKTGKIVQNDTIRFVDEELYKKWMKQEVEKGTILITSEAPFGEVYYWNSDEKIVLSQRLFGMKIKCEYNSQFIYYYMISKKFQEELRSRATGSTVTGLRQPELLKCKIILPERDIQDKIVKILYNIDKKIELNNQINDNLQGVIRNYYKEKVVNNSDFILKNMDELVEKTIGGDWGKEESTGNYNSEVLCIRGADIPEMDCGNQGKVPTRFILEKNLINKQLNGNEIIIEISGGSPTQSTGRCAYITNELKKIFDKPLICTNFCRAIKLKDDKYLPIFYMRLKELYSKNIMFLYENGTTGIKNLDLSSLMENEELSIISDEDINKFNELFYAINKKIIKNAHENRALEILRDTLLPKLMNGEIDLDKIRI